MIDKMFGLLDLIIDKLFKDEKMNKLCKKIANKETITYIFFGVLTTIVNFLIHFPTLSVVSNFMSDTLAASVATVVSWVIAVAFAFVTNKFFVFKSKDTTASVVVKECTAFFGGRVLSLLFELIWAALSIGVMGMNLTLSKIFAQIVVIIMNYFISKLLVFREKTN